MQQGQRAVMPRPYEITTESFEVPAPGPGQALIETEASAISPGTELAVYTGIHQWLSDPTRTWPRFPFVPGYSAVGRIAAVGAGVESFAVGDRVIWPGRHESHTLIDLADPHAAVWRIGEQVPVPVAACALLVRFPLTALVRSEQLLGQSVAVMGLGTIGQITLRLFSAAGAYPLIGVDLMAQRRAIAARTPGVDAIDPTAGDLRSALRVVNRGELPDIVVDATGVPDVVRAAMSAVADGGKVIMVGSPRGIAGEVDFYWDLHGRSISLIGAHGSAIGVEPREKFPFTRERALRLIVHLLESGKLRIDDLITHHVHTSELQPMYEGLLNQRDEFLSVTLHW
ncbi:MAG TPA: zinc-binding alcohol dehydrogenase [Roseiflexaceae bacterium]|jgi:2-desacetyl-2-hydroxyethyl bacteriochlorophyllide A dehydrogenase